MEKIISSLNQLKEINNAYNLSTEKIDDLQEKISEAKVCIPIIGKFSSGKSALVNTLLGYKTEILKTDITPETAIPAELNYSDENEVIHIIKNDGTIEPMTVEAYRNFDADATTVKSAKLYLKNRFLEKIPDVMIVDMPGFESGFEIHNKAIDDYLPNSLAYIVAVPADDMIIRSSIGNILKELCLRNMPICIAITKFDKKNDEFEATFEKMKESLKRYVGDRELTYCCTSYFRNDAEEIEEYLEEIQEKSQDILADSFVSYVLAIAENTENYLKTAIENNNLSESELGAKEEEIQRNLVKMEEKFNSEKKSFELELKDCVKEIKQDVQCALEAEENTLVVMLLNNQDVKEYFNNIIRNAVTVSVQNKLVARIEKYIKRVSDCLNSDDISGDINIPVNVSMEKLNKTITNSVVAVLTGFLLGPILGALTGIFLQFRSEKKKEEKRQQIKSELRNNTFPSILRDIGHNIEHEVTRIVLAINKSIDNDYQNNKETLLKSLDDLKKHINEENEKKKNLGIDMAEDLKRIKELKEALN